MFSCQWTNDVRLVPVWLAVCVADFCCAWSVTVFRVVQTIVLLQPWRTDTAARQTHNVIIIDVNMILLNN